MSPIVANILEIIKITIPALVVYYTVKTLLQQYLDKQYQLEVLRGQQQERNTNASFPMRLQAYERLSLFCERISIPNLMLRLREGGMNVRDLRITMLLAIQQEYEHNITQQVYVSDQLWQIVKMARDTTLQTIDHVATGLDDEADAKIFTTALIEHLNTQEGDPLATALLAIKKETATIL
ncbi:MAG: hypothetical protein AB8G22_19445 [Saprospiraceae bacterium]